ncbi:hypothetical protein BC827DRAFT_782636 [Russula dissimulans]|nr:hypothetical protein BC827DRAFT_782636 [Russula dissimulans]
MNLHACQYPQFRNLPWTLPINRNLIIQNIPSRNPPRLWQGSPVLRGVVFTYCANPPSGDLRPCDQIPSRLIFKMYCTTRHVYHSMYSLVDRIAQCKRRVGCESIGSRNNATFLMKIRFIVPNEFSIQIFSLWLILGARSPSRITSELHSVGKLTGYRYTTSRWGKTTLTRGVGCRVHANMLYFQLWMLGQNQQTAIQVLQYDIQVVKRFSRLVVS